MRVLVVGAGSIGRRHLGNLKTIDPSLALSIVDADGVRAAATAAATPGTSVAPSLEAALAARPDLALVCTPSALHLRHALACARAGAHLFIEKPLAASLDGVEALDAEVRNRGLLGFVGCNLRFDAVYRAAREQLDDLRCGRVYAASFHFGYDLAAWRPGVDYRNVYSARRAEGGGILLDAIHEIDLALSWFGRARRVLALPRRTGALDGDVEDVADLIIEFASGVVAQVHLDYREPTYHRDAAVAGDRATLRADFAARTVAVRRRGAEDERLAFPDDKNEMYLRELRHVLDVVRGNARPITVLAEARAALEVALGARDRGPVIELPSPSRGSKVAVVVQARMGSSRLPGKVLLKAAGETMLGLLFERLRRARRVDQLILATSTAPADRAIVDEAARLGVPCFTGDEKDVLARYVGAVRAFDLPAFVRITADCPFTDPALVDQVIDLFVQSSADYASNALPRSYPDGFDIEVASRDALERADREVTRAEIREHVTLHIALHPERYQHVSLTHPDAARLAPLRFTLDTPSDYELIRAVFEALYPRNPAFSMRDVLVLLEREPHIAALHKKVAPAGGAG